jgi:hypothetical protein
MLPKETLFRLHLDDVIRPKIVGSTTYRKMWRNESWGLPRHDADLKKVLVKSATKAFLTSPCISFVTRDFQKYASCRLSCLLTLPMHITELIRLSSPSNLFERESQIIISRMRSKISSGSWRSKPVKCQYFHIWI